MASFRKKPITVQAEQWFPGKIIPGEVEIEGVGEGRCSTIQGHTARIRPGDWVITEPDGVHHYPCDPEVFANTYEQIWNEPVSYSGYGTTLEDV